MKQSSNDNRIISEEGFTLVELVISVAIIAIASVGLMKAFSMAGIVNGKAQRMQNATSLAESVMEEIKSSSIKQLEKTYNGGSVKTISTTDAAFAALSPQDKASQALTSVLSGTKGVLLTGGTTDSPYYVLCLKDAVATKGETFNVTATMRTATYSGTDATDASDANSKKLPVISEIDPHTKTVLSSKELNKYDVAASDYFKEHTGAGTLTLGSKEIIVDKRGNGAAVEDGEIRVKCSVVYTASDNETKFKKDVFNGTYIPQTDKDGTLQPVNNSVYIFYNRFIPYDGSVARETITVNDSSDNDDHKVYIIFQKDLNQTATDLTDDKPIVGSWTLEDDSLESGQGLLGTKINITNGDSSKITANSNGDIHYDDDGDSSTLDLYGHIKKDNFWLITNLGKSAGDEGFLLEKKNKNRIFEVTVDVTKTGDSKTYATLTSTMSIKE